MGIDRIHVVELASSGGCGQGCALLSVIMDKKSHELAKKLFESFSFREKKIIRSELFGESNG